MAQKYNYIKIHGSSLISFYVNVVLEILLINSLYIDTNLSNFNISIQILIF